MGVSGSRRIEETTRYYRISSNDNSSYDIETSARRFIAYYKLLSEENNESR